MPLQEAEERPIVSDAREESLLAAYDAEGADTAGCVDEQLDLPAAGTVPGGFAAGLFEPREREFRSILAFLVARDVGDMETPGAPGAGTRDGIVGDIVVATDVIRTIGRTRLHEARISRIARERRKSWHGKSPFYTVPPWDGSRDDTNATYLHLQVTCVYDTLGRMITSSRDILKGSGLRATPGRARLLDVLACERVPRTVEELRRKLDGRMNEVTLYRALEALAEKGIVERSDLRHGHAHYELAAGRPHHHHAVCRSCGMIEDVEIPHPKEPAKEAERVARGFARIDAYALEFFGLCNRCA